MTPFRHRTVACPEGCDNGRVYFDHTDGFGDGYATHHDCDWCSGEGVLPAECDDCGKDAPTNNDGLCEECAALTEQVAAELAFTIEQQRKAAA